MSRHAYVCLTLVAAILVAVTVVSTPGAPEALAQNTRTSRDGLWTKIDEPQLSVEQLRTLPPTLPTRSETFNLNQNVLERLLRRHELTLSSEGESDDEISIPVPGPRRFLRFRVEEAPVAAPELAEQMGGVIQTFRGQGIDEPTYTVAYDVTDEGLNGTILTPEGIIVIRPLVTDEDGTVPHQSFLRELLPINKERFTCRVTDDQTQAIELSAVPPTVTNFSAGQTLRTYRLAVAATGEYTEFHGGTVRSAYAAIVRTINRVNQIYEKDLAVRFELVKDESKIIFTDPATDPYPDASATPAPSPCPPPSPGASQKPDWCPQPCMKVLDCIIEKNQATLNAIIKPENYDIGHVFARGGSGLAETASLCAAKYKGMGVSGHYVPEGDAYDVDYVAHELGHQLGASHTFNGTTNGCVHRKEQTAYEPGSGSTIMAYAGLCDDEHVKENLQEKTDPFFHVASLHDISRFISSPAVGRCGTESPNPNRAPVVSAGRSYTIPKRTPFTLTATGSDPDRDALTYSWEELDLGKQAPPNDDEAEERPIFRSFTPTEGHASRTFPALPNILSGVLKFGEAYPTRGRTMRFAVTARDNRFKGGRFSFATVNIVVFGEIGPFVVTQPSLPVTWAAGSQQTVVWDPAGTAGAPINCQTVKISLSTDGGNNFSTVLAESTLNDGSETVLVPQVVTSEARIKVEAVNNTFFNISPTNFKITTSPR